MMRKREREVKLKSVAKRRHSREVKSGNRNVKMIKELHEAAQWGDFDAVERLIKKGVDVNVVDENKWTPLHLVARCGYVDIAKILIRNGAELNAETNGGLTPLHHVAMMGNYRMARTLIEKGADINALDKHKRTAFFIAVEHDRTDVAKLLIEHGSEVNAITDKKSSALHMVVKREYDDFMNVLLHEGADVNAVTVDKETVLDKAVMKGDLRCILRLLCFGARINKQAIRCDETKLLGQINDRIVSLRKGNGMQTTLMSEEEKRFMWNLAFCFTVKYRGAAFKAYYAIRSFITYNGIFMGPGYDLGDGSIWKEKRRRDDLNEMWNKIFYKILTSSHS